MISVSNMANESANKHLGVYSCQLLHLTPSCECNVICTANLGSNILFFLDLRNGQHLAYGLVSLPRYSRLPILRAFTRTLLDLFQSAFKHCVQLAGYICSVGLDCLHAAEDKAFETLPLLVQNIKSFPRCLL